MEAAMAETKAEDARGCRRAKVEKADVDDENVLNAPWDMVLFLKEERKGEI